MVFALLGVVAPRVAHAKTSSVLAEPQRLDVPNAPEAFFYRSWGKGPKPVVLYLHGRGGNPLDDCRKWARVASTYGWLVCPQGPVVAENGGRTWATGPGDAKRIVDATLAALAAKYPGKVQKRNNILVGFSEGAFVAMQIGLADQRTWNRWLILGASDAYWGGEVLAAVRDGKGHLHRVFLLTGENDGVAEATMRVGRTLRQSKVATRVRIVPGLGHEVPRDRMVSTYRRPLAWLAAQ